MVNSRLFVIFTVLVYAHHVQGVEYSPTDSDIDYSVYMAGSTSSSKFIQNRLIEEVCNSSGTKEITVYQRNEDEWILICLQQALGVHGGGHVRFIKQGGGSGDGTTPVSRPALAQISYPDPASFTPAVQCDAKMSKATATGTPFAFFDNCFMSSMSVDGADIGVIDVRPNLFFDGNTPSTGYPYTAATDDAYVYQYKIGGLNFGVVATVGLRNALQALQFPAGSACHPGNDEWDEILPTTADVLGDGSTVSLDVARVPSGTYNTGADTSPSWGVATVADSEPCMPNLTSIEISGMLTGRITVWDRLQREGVTLITAAQGAGLPVPTFNANPAINNRRAHVCRRNDGSGTQAVSNAFFLSRPCSYVDGTIVAEGPLSAGSNSCTYTGMSVTCNVRGTEDVGECLDDFENSTNTSGMFFGPGPFAPRYAWAIGVVSTERNVALERDYRFVRVDGLAPSIKNTYLADSTLHYESMCLFRMSGLIDINAYYPNVLDVVEELCDVPPAFDLFKANQNFLHAWGIGGWLAVPDGPGGTVPDASNMAVDLMDPAGPNPTNSWTRGGFACRAPTVTDPVQSTLEGDL